MFENSHVKNSETFAEGAMNKAEFHKGEFRCPKCKSLLLKARYGAKAKDLEVWCRRCKVSVLVEIEETE